MSSSQGHNNNPTQEKFGFNLLRKKQQAQPSNRSDRRADDSSSDEEEAGANSNYVSNSQLNLPSFKPSAVPADELQRANDGSFGTRPAARTPGTSGSFNHRQRMIEDDAIATIRDNSGADRCFDDVEENENESGNEEEQTEPHEGPSGIDVSPKASPVEKKLQFKSRPSIIPEDEVVNDAGEYYEEKENEKSDDQDDTFSTQSSEGKMDHFRSLFRRKSTVRAPHGSRTSRDSGGSQRGGGMKNLNGSNEDEDEGFFSKFLSITGGGLTPAMNNTQPSGEDDHERNAGQNNMEDPVPMADIAATAQQIVQAHSNMAHGPKPTGEGSEHAATHNPGEEPPAGGKTGDASMSPHEPTSPFNHSTDGETMVSSHQDDPFYVPAVNHYDDIDDPDDLEPLMIEGSYIAPAERVRGGVLGSLLKLYQNEDEQFTKSQLSLNSSVEQTPEPHALSDKGEHKSGKRNYNPFQKISKSQTNLAGMAKSASNMNLPNFKATRPKAKNLAKARNFKKKAAAEARITVHIADLLQRHRFILRLCKALMLYGAPTHRLEEYMVMTSRVLEIDGQFLYVPGCMIISFGDMTTRTSEVQLVRCNQGLNLSKLHSVHSIYKQVVHDIMSVEDANIEIDQILNGKNLYPPWVSVLLYAFCSSMVTPFAFGGDWINMAVSFGIGLCVGSLQFIVSQKSNLYSNVFEVTASIVVSFCGRALGSIPNSNICFGSVVQGSLALILPGYIILCGSLELQSRNLVAGAVRMFYAIIYSLFLGFGITLGAALFGWIYNDATNETTCDKSVSPLYRLIFVPCFSIGLGLINQAKWTQLPVMTLISCCGYVVTYFSGKHFANSTEFTSAMAAFIIGILGNLYSRIWKGFAVSAMLPAIFVQVPSGVASQSSLLAGVQSANNIVKNGTTTVVTDDLSGSMSFGVTMIQVSIGISVGLFASTLFVYPFGKKRTGLFTL
ncbi:unnamed protein product [Kluyveromyces dobzhanskii CBS 2104]|uniref:Pheromone-regulated membrane protein 10 n=1 Tax=Kluyveromyces dobzhanskii CBS 2104 TaxID=1427455 RepID=A0A0A8L5W8_9SACH|nr:unnamed protein product [Kluyveromyces dobzhanskii CBS 2104]